MLGYYIKYIYKIARLSHALDEIHMGTVDNNTQKASYNTMYDRVDVDEKWFYMTRQNARYILVGDRPERILNYFAEDTPIDKYSISLTSPRWCSSTPRRVQDWTQQQIQCGMAGWVFGQLGHCGHTQRSSLNREAGEEIWVDEKVTKVKY